MWILIWDGGREAYYYDKEELRLFFFAYITKAIMKLFWKENHYERKT